jgi:hypothetical protein
MTDPVVALPTLAELAAFVRKALCEQDALDLDTTPFFRAPLTRGGRACGFVFHVEGPRMLKTSAVWVAETDRVAFYDSTGNRVRDVRLSEAPSIADCGSRIADCKPAQQAAA